MLHVQHTLQLQSVFRVVQDTLAVLPIETLTFSSDEPIGLVEFDDCSHIASVCAALRQKGVLKMVSIQPATYVPPRTVAELKALEDDGLVLQMKYLK